MSRRTVTTRQHLIRRNGVYQFRMRVPLDVVDAVGKTHVHHSLRTRNPTEAGRLRDFWYLKCQAEFDQLRAERGAEQSAPAYTIALARLKPLVEDWLQTQLQLVASEQGEGPEPFVDPGETVDRADDVAHLKADLQRLSSSSAHLQQDVKRLAGQFLFSDGAPKAPSPSNSTIRPPEFPDVDETSPEFRQLCAIVGAALREANRIDIADPARNRPPSYRSSWRHTTFWSSESSIAGSLDDRIVSRSGSEFLQPLHPAAAIAPIQVAVGNVSHSRYTPCDT